MLSFLFFIFFLSTITISEKWPKKSDPLHKPPSHLSGYYWPLILCRREVERMGWEGGRRCGKCHCCNNGLLHLDNLASCTAANRVIFLHLLYVNNAITSFSPCINNTTAALRFQRHWWILELQQLRWSMRACPCLPPSLHFNFTLKTVAISIVWLQLLQKKIRLYLNSGGSSAQRSCWDISYHQCHFFVYSQMKN